MSIVTKLQTKLNPELKRHLLKFLNENIASKVWKTPIGDEERHLIDFTGLEEKVTSEYAHMCRGRRSITLRDICNLEQDEMVLYHTNKMIDDIIKENEWDETQLRRQPAPGIGHDNWDSHLISLVYETQKKVSHGIETHYVNNSLEDNWTVMRINYMVQKPEQGGTPQIDKTFLNNRKPGIKLKQIDINEDEGYVMMPSKWAHGCTPVTGNTIRVLLSLLFYVEPHYFNEHIMPTYG